MDRHYLSCVCCTQRVSGAAIVIGLNVLHPECELRWRAAELGLKFTCPKCKTKGKLDDESKPIKVLTWDRPGEPGCAWNGCRSCPECMGPWERVTGYQQKNCDLCNGYGYLKTEAKPIVETKILGWKT